MIKINIDGQVLTANKDDTLIEVADNAGIHIPRFCYHKHLSTAANCRMCLVDVANSKNPVAACAAPVFDGMQVSTKSPKAIAAQKAVMEFLLINHPLDCPVCDQGGECELQDNAMGYGEGKSQFAEVKRTVSDPSIGPLITTVMNRCIHCTRCIRYGKEIAGVQEFGLVSRGVETEVRTYMNEAVKTNLAGNVIDICPVGALNSKPYNFSARSWEMHQHASIARHDALGSHLNVHTRDHKVMRVVAKECESLNQVWLSDRDRFSYTGLYHAERLSAPMVKDYKTHHEKSLMDAMVTAAKSINQIVKDHGPQAVGGVISPNATTQELYLWQKLMRSIGSSNIDSRLRINDPANLPLTNKEAPVISSLDELDGAENILVLGANIENEQPLLGVRVRQAKTQGAKLHLINSPSRRKSFKLTPKLF